MRNKIFYIFLILNIFLLHLHSKPVYSEPVSRFHIDISPSFLVSTDSNYRALYRKINALNFKNLFISNSFLNRPTYDFALLNNSLQTTFSDNNSYTATPVELNLSIGFDLSPYLSVTGGFKQNETNFNMGNTGSPSFEKHFGYKYTDTTFSILGVTPPVKGISLYGDINVGRIVIESENILPKKTIGFYLSEEVGFAYTPSPRLAVFLGYNTHTVDPKIINAVFGGRFGLDVIKGLKLGFHLVY